MDRVIRATNVRTKKTQDFEITGVSAAEDADILANFTATHGRNYAEPKIVDVAAEAEKAKGVAKTAAKKPTPAPVATALAAGVSTSEKIADVATASKATSETPAIAMTEA